MYAEKSDSNEKRNMIARNLFILESKISKKVDYTWLREAVTNYLKEAILSRPRIEVKRSLLKKRGQILTKPNPTQTELAEVVSIDKKVKSVPHKRADKILFISNRMEIKVSFLNMQITLSDFKHDIEYKKDIDIKSIDLFPSIKELVK
jgi:hypothetical protein